MSVEAVGWALQVPVSGNAKIMLLGLANHAHPDGSESYPTLGRLAAYGRCSKDTARRNVRELVELGWAVEDGYGPRGQSKYRLRTDLVPPPPDGGSKMLGVANCYPSPSAGRGDSKEPKSGIAPLLPEPSLVEPSLEPSSSGRGTAREPDEVPVDFPDELRPHARHVYRVLADLARRHGAREVNPRSLALTIMARPRHPLILAAHDFAAWAESQPQVRRDVVAGYRNWLGRCGALAATELLPGAEVTSEGPSNVTRLPSARGGREHPASRRIREIEEVKQRLRTEGK